MYADERILKARLLKKSVVKVGFSSKSVIIRIPIEILERTGITVGEKIKLDTKNGTIVVRKLTPKEFELVEHF